MAKGTLRLRTLKRPFDDKLMFIRGSLSTARDTAQQAGSEIRDLLANTRADNDVWVRILRYLGVSEDAALAIPNGVTGLSTAAVLVLWKYNPVLGPLSAIFSTLKVFNAGQDLADLRRASRLVPEFLEMSESEAWLEPLDLSYTAVNEPFQAVIEIVEAYDP